MSTDFILKRSIRIMIMGVVALMAATGWGAETIKGENRETGASTITVKPDNLFVVSDSKDIQKLVDGLKKQEPAAAADKAEGSKVKNMVHKNPFTGGFWVEVKERAASELGAMDSLNAFRLSNVYILVCGIFMTCVAIVAFRKLVMGVFLTKLCSRTESDLDDKLCVALRAPFELIIFAIGFYFSSLKIILDLPAAMDFYASRLCQAVVVASFAWGVYRSVDILSDAVSKYTAKTESKLDDLIVILMRKTLKIVVVIVTVLFIGQNILGLNITTLLAGAGIFGLAIAFAAQDTIANFFGSIMIVIDKPFFVGDRIKVEGHDGVVVNVGFRSTKIQTADGHLVTLPNKKMTESTVENVSGRPYIRFVANLGLTYDTTPEKMERAMKLLHEIFDHHTGMKDEKPPLIFFDNFKDWSLNIQVITWYYPSDWEAAMAWWSDRNLEILKRFNADGLSFAFPSSTTYVANDDGKKFEINLNPGMNKAN